MSLPTLDPDTLLAELLLSSEGRADPYSRYAQIREHGRTFRSALGMVVLSRYDDCQWILRDPRFGHGDAWRAAHGALYRSDWNDVKALVEAAPSTASATANGDGARPLTDARRPSPSS